MITPNSHKKAVTCDILNPNHRCSPLIKQSYEKNKSFDIFVGISTKESTRIKGLYVTQFIEQTKTTKSMTKNIKIKCMIDQQQ